MISIKDINKNFIPLRLEILSPVHIGAGEPLSPLEYQIEQQEGQNTVFTIDYDAWLNSLTPYEIKQIANEFSIKSLNEIWQLLRKKINKNIFVKTKSKTTEKVYKKYIARLSETGQSQNELLPSLRNPITSTMIIPGSSLKGAIRTAIIDEKDNG